MIYISILKGGKSIQLSKQKHFSEPVAGTGCSVVGYLLSLVVNHPLLLRIILENAVLAGALGLSGAEVFDGGAAEGALIVTLLDPALQALCVEIVARVALELGDDVVGFVRDHADDAVGVVAEFIWVILRPPKASNDTRHLCLNHGSVVGVDTEVAAVGPLTPALTLSAIAHEHVDARDGAEHHDIDEDHDVADEKDHEHHRGEEGCVRILVAVIGI